MKLLLTSAGLSNPSIVNALVELTECPLAEINLAIIPTAANVEWGDKSWLIDDFVNCQKLGFKTIDLVDISALPQELWLPRLEKADVLLFEGGNTFHLMYWLNKSGLSQQLRGLLETRVYVGISAGSMVACRNLDMSDSERLYDEAVGEGSTNDGLGFADILIRPHLNSPYFPKVSLENLEVIAKENPQEFYAFDDNTAFKVVNGKIEVISEGAWKKFN